MDKHTQLLPRPSTLKDLISVVKKFDENLRFAFLQGFGCDAIIKLMSPGEREYETHRALARHEYIKQKQKGVSFLEASMNIKSPGSTLEELFQLLPPSVNSVDKAEFVATLKHQLCDSRPKTKTMIRSASDW